MARKKSRKITYDSHESKTVFGLLSLAMSILCFLMVFVEIKNSLLENIVFLFGGGTSLLGTFFLVLAVKLFHIKPNLITWRTVFGLLLITLAWCTYLTGGVGLPLNAKKLAYSGDFGGIVGYHISDTISSMLFRDVVQPFSVIIIFLSIPLILSITIPQYFSGIKSVFVWIMNSVSKERNIELDTTEQIEVKSGVQAKMVGDFQDRKTVVPQTTKQISKEKGDEKKEEKPKSIEGAKFVGIADGQLIDKSTVNVNIKSSSEGGAELLMQSELKYPEWKLPPVNLLKPFSKTKPLATSINKNTEIIEQTLQSFGVKAQVVDVLIGPSVTQYALNIALGTKVSKISNLRNDLALALALSANGVRIEAPIPGTSFVGIEVPNKEREMVTFRELIENEKSNKGNLPATLGKNVLGECIYLDIQKMPHLLIAGATGSGKSVVTNSFIMSLLMKKTPDQVRLILVDPKQVEMSDYNGIPHLLTPVITDMEKVNNSLKWSIAEMERRYTEFTTLKVRNIEAYNEKLGFSAMPYIMIVIDEMADMMMTKHGTEIESSIVRLAQKARATGIHLILATQRPSVDVITGLIKANIPGRIGMSVTTQIDSRVILDQIGAESLLGYGDLLFKDPSKNRLERIQATFVSQDEVTKVVNYIKEQAPEVEYTEAITASPISDSDGGEIDEASLSDDQLFIQAARVVVGAMKGSSSLIQRKLSVGYNRAARLLDELEEHGIVGPARGSKPRDILVTDIDAFLQSRNNSQNEEADQSEYEQSEEERTA